MPIYFTVAAAIAAAQAVTQRFDTGGKIEVYDGTKPATADTAITTQNKLVEFIIPSPGFGPAADVPGQSYVAAPGNPVPAADPVAAGTATWARIKDSNGNTVYDGNVGNAASTAYVRMSSTQVQLGVGVSPLSHEYRQPKQ